MAYKELIKDFERIRDYMRAFYVYGFMHREEFDAKSARSYDNEKRRIESWLGEYLSFRQDSDGKAVFLSVDSRDVPHNPLYKAFKAKTFTANDIMLHFYILDILDGEREMSVKELIDCITEEYLGELGLDWVNDESTVRKKLKEYENLGIINKKKRGREIVYTCAEQKVDLERWKEAVPCITCVTVSAIKKTANLWDISWPLFLHCSQFLPPSVLEIWDRLLPSAKAY